MSAARITRRRFAAGLAAAGVSGMPRGLRAAESPQHNGHWLAPTPCAAFRPEILKRLSPLGFFFEKLQQLEFGNSQKQVNVLQIGDSHTANDGFSGRMRELFQNRFGNAGRGMLPPGIPFKLYNPAGVKVTSEGWEPISAMDPHASPPFGITALRQRAAGKARMTLTAEYPGDLAVTDLEFLLSPGHGSVQLRFDNGHKDSFDTKLIGGKEHVDPELPIWIRLAGQTARSITITTNNDGPVEMLSWTVQRLTPGVTWSNLGTIGAKVDLLKQWDPTIVRDELARREPDLIILAFGTNEGFDDKIDVADYPKLYRSALWKLLNTLYHVAPTAQILLVSPPDGSQHTTVTSSDSCGNGWEEPKNLASIRRTQHQVAQELNIPIWDWADAMGGRCTMPVWAAAQPPLANADHMHLLRAGYRRTADALFAHLMDGYKKYLGM